MFGGVNVDNRRCNHGPMAKLVDATDLKSVDLRVVSVRVRVGLLH